MDAVIVCDAKSYCNAFKCGRIVCMISSQFTNPTKTQSMLVSVWKSPTNNSSCIISYNKGQLFRKVLFGKNDKHSILHTYVKFIIKKNAIILQSFWEKSQKIFLKLYCYPPPPIFIPDQLFVPKNQSKSTIKIYNSYEISKLYNLQRHYIRKPWCLV